MSFQVPLKFSMFLIHFKSTGRVFQAVGPDMANEHSPSNEESLWWPDVLPAPNQLWNRQSLVTIMKI